MSLPKFIAEFFPQATHDNVLAFRNDSAPDGFSYVPAFAIKLDNLSLCLLVEDDYGVDQYSCDYMALDDAARESIDNDGPLTLSAALGVVFEYALGWGSIDDSEYDLTISKMDEGDEYGDVVWFSALGA